MKIAGYLKTSLIEWPGKISSVIFTPGCNFRCPFCHNVDLVDLKRFDSLDNYPEAEILADIQKRKQWVEAVVVTGGEPLLQPGLSRFLSRLKRSGFKTMVETNGSLYSALDILLKEKLVDYWALDYKTLLGDYRKLVGAKKGEALAVRRSYAQLAGKRAGFELRTTVVPGIHDRPVLLKMAREAKSIFSSRGEKFLPVWYLQTFQPDNCLNLRYRRRKPFSPQMMKKLWLAVKGDYPPAKLRGN